MAIALVAAGVGVYRYLSSRPSGEPEAPPAASAEDRIAVAPFPELPETWGTRSGGDARARGESAIGATPEPPPQIPLPELDDSDTEIRGALVELLGAEPIQTWLDPEHVIRNVVVTIDNLPRHGTPFEQRPIRAVPGEFLTTGPDEQPVLDENNFDRYSEFVELVAGLDPDALLRLYGGYRPLFDEAYRDLGYPDGNFDARLVEVIDHLLEAPAVEGPIRLAQPGVMYEFADEAIESSSAGHKLLMRIGPDNAAVIKRKLQELRAALAGTAGDRAANTPEGGAPGAAENRAPDTAQESRRDAAEDGAPDTAR